MASINFQNISLAIWGIVSAAVAFFALVIYLLIWPLVAGSIANVATSGSINIDSNWSDAIVNVSAEGAGLTKNLMSQAELPIELIAIVVVIIVFGVGGIFAFLKKKMGGSGKGSAF